MRLSRDVGGMSISSEEAGTRRSSHSNSDTTIKEHEHEHEHTHTMTRRAAIAAPAPAPAPPPSNDITAWERNRRFGIVIDAGSSGSRLQIYSWLDHSTAKKERLKHGQSIAVLPRIDKGVKEGDAWTMKVEPGGLARACLHAFLLLFGGDMV